MADETTTGATPADQGATPAAQPEPQQPAATAESTTEPLGETGLAALKREREQREAAEKREKDLVKRLKSFEDRDKSESEKTAERIAELEKELAGERAARQDSTLRMATFAAARKLGFRNPDLAHRLLSASDLEYADDGSPKNVERLLASIAEAEPYLVNTTPDYGGGPRGTSAGAGTDMNKLIRQKAGRA